MMRFSRSWGVSRVMDAPGTELLDVILLPLLPATPGIALEEAYARNKTGRGRDMHQRAG